MRTVWRILLAAAALVVVAALVFVGWIVFGPGPTDFAGRDRVALADYKGADPDWRSGEPQGREPHRSGPLPHPRRRLRGLPYGDRRATFRRRPGVRPALRHDLFDQHHARQGDRHRPVRRRGVSGGRSPRCPTRRRAALPGDALRQLHLSDGRRRARHQSLSLQPQPDQRAGDPEHLRLSVRSALGDGHMGDDVQRRSALRAARRSQRRVESRRLSGRGARPLRGMPHAAQPFPGARRASANSPAPSPAAGAPTTSRAIRRAGSATGPNRRWRTISRRDTPRGAARRPGPWAKRSTSVSCT